VTALFPPELLTTESGFQSMGVFTIVARVSKYYEEGQNALAYKDLPGGGTQSLVTAWDETCWNVYNVTADWDDLVGTLRREVSST